MYQAIKPYFEGDELENDLEKICHSAFSFPVPFHHNEGRDTLELFYGPTAAFKDFGARFLAFSMEKLLEKRNRDLCILVATSGDTGGAVASAFHNRKHLSVKVLFPKGRVAERQQKQLTCWDGNVESYEVDGTFDDCQISGVFFLRWHTMYMPHRSIRRYTAGKLSSSSLPAM